jgi:cyclophilin family peptidyl-prolyl cis-trans isomerase
MANNAGMPDTNGCQFFITLSPLTYLDRRAVVLGEVLEGFPLLRRVNELPTDLLDRPRPPVQVAACGLLEGEPLHLYKVVRGAVAGSDKGKEGSNGGGDTGRKAAAAAQKDA